MPKDVLNRFLERRINADMSEYFRRMREFDWFIVRLAEGRACAEGPVGFKYYDALHRAVCGSELADFDAGPGPYRVGGPPPLAQRRRLRGMRLAGEGAGREAALPQRR